MGVLTAMAPLMLGVPSGSTPKQPPGIPDISRVSGKRLEPISSDWQQASLQSAAKPSNPENRMSHYAWMKQVKSAVRRRSSPTEIISRFVISNYSVG